MDVKREGEALELFYEGREIGVTLGGPVKDEELVPYVVVPTGWQIHKAERLPLEERAERPKRVKANVLTLTPESFVDYFNKYGNAHSRVFIDLQKPAVIGYIDYHQQPAPDSDALPVPQFGHHTVSYHFRHTVEWKAWIANDGKDLDQLSFAEFIEDNLAEVAHPSPADLLQATLRLEAKKSVNFSSGIRLDNGEVQFTYEENISGSAQRGSIEIPTTFSLAIAPFDGGARYELIARLRWRISGGGLKLRYDLMRPEKVIETAAERIAESIATDVSGGVTYGAPN